MGKKRTSLTGTLLFSLGILLSCQSAPERISRTDWADVTLYATGVGPVREWSPEERIRAIQQAKRDVARQLEEQIVTLRTDSGKTLFEQAQKGDKMKKIAAFVRGAQMVSLENKAEGISLRARLFLGDHFKATLGLLPQKEVYPSSPRDQRGSF